MKEKEEGEELINLDEQIDTNRKKNKENHNKNNNKKIYANKRNIFLVISIFLIIFIMIYFYKKFMTILPKQKTLIIFDFDKTLTSKDVFEEQRFLLPSREEQEELMEKLNYENWTALMSSFYERMYELNITISDINDCIDKMEFTPGMIELLKYFQINKDKYSLVILSAGHHYQVLQMLQRFNLINLFDEIITIPSHVDNGKIIITQSHNYDCDICNVGQCKTYEYNLLIDKFKKNKNIIFDKVFFFCDGLNDYCLVRNLKENDIIFVRKGFTLYKGLYKEKMINSIKSKVNFWEDGFDIIRYFKENKI